MKQVSAQLQAHLEGEVTSLCTCWLIQRQDGEIFAFTDHDEDLVIDGQTYEAATGFMRSAISNSGAFGVDELEAQGFLDSESLTEQDLRAERFNYAEVWLFMVNWQDLTQGILRLRYGNFGEVSILPSGMFRVELRGLLQKLSQTMGNVYMPECRTDLGDSRCKVVLDPDERVASREYAVNDRVKVENNPDVKLYQLPIISTDSATGWYGYLVARTQLLQLFGLNGGTFLSQDRGSIHSAMSPGQSNSFASTYFPLYGAGGVTVEDIDAGGMEVHLEWLQANADAPGNGGVGIEFRNAAGTFISRVEPSLEQIRPINLWRKRERNITVPTGARQANIYGAFGQPADSMVTGASLSAIAGITGVIRPLLSEAVEYLAYGGVEYRCIGGGVTSDDVADAFSRVVGETFVDGTVTWEVIVPTHRVIAQVDVVTSRMVFTVTGGETKPDEWFRWGVVEVLTGPARGFRIECRSWTQATGRVELVLPLPYMLQHGDYLLMQTGCDKSRDECRVKFGNIINFRGEPDIPGTDQYFKVGKPV